MLIICIQQKLIYFKMIPTNESNSKSEEESSFFLKNKIEFKELNKFNLNKYGMGLGVLI